MITSMTGYGRAHIQTDSYSVTIEIKTVNHRYSDISIKIPKQFLLLEEKIKKIVQRNIQRGKVDLFVTIEGKGAHSRMVEVDWDLVEQFKQIFDKSNRTYGNSEILTLHSLLGNSEVFHIREKEGDISGLENILLEATEKCLQAVIEMRKKEGSILFHDFLAKLEVMEENVALLYKKSKEIIPIYQERLKRKIEEVLHGDLQIDEGRLLTEVAIYADKSDITEELERLKSHISQFKQALQSTDPVGRKLDFIVQEMNREINTIGSKSNDIAISQYVVELKSDLEKVREQAQNIE